MRIFFDTEFQEQRSRALDFISLGMVREDGAELYVVQPFAVIAGCVFVNHLPVSEWVQTNVFRHIQWPSPNSFTDNQRNNSIVEFCGEAPEFWADYGAYDWVVLCQLFGTMMDLPKGWPMFVRDFQQHIEFTIQSRIDTYRGDPQELDHWLSMRNRMDESVKQDPATLHHALHDAKHLKAQFEFLHSQ